MKSEREGGGGRECVHPCVKESVCAHVRGSE